LIGGDDQVQQTAGMEQVIEKRSENTTEEELSLKEDADSQGSSIVHSIDQVVKAAENDFSQMLYSHTPVISDRGDDVQEAGNLSDVKEAVVVSKHISNYVKAEKKEDEDKLTLKPNVVLFQ